MSSPLPPGCEIACPGCGYREFSPEESRARKESFVRRELAPFAEVVAPLAEPRLRWGYRRKALLHVRRAEGGWAIGMIKRRGREEEFIPIPECPAHFGGVNDLFRFAQSRVPAHFPWVFALVSGRALTLVMKSKREEAWVSEIGRWEKEWPAGHSLFVNWNPSAGNRALDSRRTELVLGEAWLEDEGLLHGPVAFRQQIPEVEEAAVAAGREFLKAAGADVCVDFYCGLGASLREWENLNWNAVGVELSGESLAAAAKNAPSATLLRGRTEERLPQVDSFLAGRPFVLYTNPPRDGHGEAVNQWILSALPLRVAYLSCNPRSLGRDLGLLNRAYEVEKVLPFDFFPQTPHVEALALLTRRPGL